MNQHEEDDWTDSIDVICGNPSDLDLSTEERSAIAVVRDRIRRAADFGDGRGALPVVLSSIDEAAANAMLQGQESKARLLNTIRAEIMAPGGRGRPKGRSLVYIAAPFGAATMPNRIGNALAAMALQLRATRLGNVPIAVHASILLGGLGRDEDSGERKQGLAVATDLARLVGLDGGELWVLVRFGLLSDGVQAEIDAYVGAGGRRIRVFTEPPGAELLIVHQAMSALWNAVAKVADVFTTIEFNADLGTQTVRRTPDGGAS